MSSQANTDSDESEEPKTTRVTFHNPEEGDLPNIYEQEDTARQHFEAARYIQEEIGSGRTKLFGDFAVAVQQFEEEDDLSELLNLYTKLASGEIRFTEEASPKEWDRIDSKDVKQAILVRNE